MRRPGLARTHCACLPRNSLPRTITSRYCTVACQCTVARYWSVDFIRRAFWLIIACKSIFVAVHAFRVYFFYCFVHTEKQTLLPILPKSPRKCAISALKYHNFFSLPPGSFPCGEGDTPSPHLTPLGAFGASTRLAPSALDLGSPTSTPGSAYASKEDFWIKSRVVVNRSLFIYPGEIVAVEWKPCWDGWHETASVAAAGLARRSTKRHHSTV